jgi:hypothetical protein
MLTTIASVAAACLDEVLEAKTAFFPPPLRRALRKHRGETHLRRCALWRKVLGSLILAFADQQLVTGFAILITGWIFYNGDRFTGAHFSLIVYLSSLSSCSHLAAIVTLRQYFIDNPALAALRIVFIAAFAILLAASIAVSNAFGPFYAILWYVIDRIGLSSGMSYSLASLLSIAPIFWAFWTGIWQIVPKSRDRFKAWVKSLCRPLSSYLSAKFKGKLSKLAIDVLRFVVFLNPGMVFLLQICFAFISVALAMMQKFMPGESYECSLNSKEESAMGFGQILAFLLLALPLIAAVEGYMGNHISNAQFLA